MCSFCWNCTERQILWSLCSVDFHTLTLQLPIQTLHSVAPELQVFVSSLKFSVKRAHPWWSLKFCKIAGTPAHPWGVLVLLLSVQILVRLDCFSHSITMEVWKPGVCSFCWNCTERQILWSLCSVDFHTLTLKLPIQTLHSVAPELQVFVSSLKFSVKRAHPCSVKNSQISPKRAHPWCNFHYLIYLPSATKLRRLCFSS